MDEFDYSSIYYKPASELLILKYSIRVSPAYSKLEKNYDFLLDYFSFNIFGLVLDLMITKSVVHGGTTGCFYSSNLQYKHNKGWIDQKKFLIVKFKINNLFIKDISSIFI
jgi:hypothetical protein